MNVKEYLARIGYNEDLIPDLKTLQELQQAHLLKVPFENLDIHRNVPIQLDTELFYTKIVINRRGGFCYELNGLFHMLLTQLGFEARLVSGRVFDKKRDVFGAEHDHMAVLVELEDGTYLVDVGFGEFTFHPLKLEMGQVQRDPRGEFVIERHDADYLKVSQREKNTDSVLYIFTTKARTLDEFAGMCQYHQTSPDSNFTQKRLISLPTQTGRTTLTGNTLKISEADQTKVQRFDEGDFGELLRNRFGISEYGSVIE